MDAGINELFEGVTITRGETKIVLPPSSFAEAQIAFMKPAQLRQNIDDAVRAAPSGATPDLLTMRRATERHGNNLYEVLEEKIKGDHEGSLHLLEGDPVISEGFTGGGVFNAIVKRRGDERKERHRKVSITLDGKGDIVGFFCQCPTYHTNLAKGNYDALREIDGLSNGSSQGLQPTKGLASKSMSDVSGFPLVNVQVACYHVAVALINIAKKTGNYKLPYGIGNADAVEALFMDKIGRKKEATIDDHLIGRGVIIDETVQRISEGYMTLEVIKHMKNIEGRVQQIIMRIKERREKDGYVFSGFATDFRGTQYKTASIVLTKADGRSVHILHDTNLGIGLPLVMLNVPVGVWVGNLGKEPVRTEMPENPLQSFGSYVTRFDERTQREVVSIITRPEREILKPAEIAVYAGLILRQPMLPQLQR